MAVHAGWQKSGLCAEVMFPLDLGPRSTRPAPAAPRTPRAGESPTPHRTDTLRGPCMRSPMPRAALLLFAALTFAAPVAAADVFNRLDPVAARAITRTRAASPDAAGLLDVAEPTATLMSVDEGAM